MSSIKKKLKDNSFINSIYWKYIYCPAVLQADLSELMPVADNFNGCSVKELTINSPMFDKYLAFINAMYEEKIYTKKELIQLLSNHYWLRDVKTYVLINKSNQIVSTISTGKYKNNEKWGGVFKFATDKNKRKQGLGLYMLRYGYGRLKTDGCSYGESIVSFRKNRIPSLMTHFKCGFIPQMDRKLVVYELVNRRGGVKHWFTRNWVMKYYQLYFRKHYK